ncbi:MAG: hypothetical protein ACXQT3_06075, partial [Methermicoccaceae archaeon]
MSMGILSRLFGTRDNPIDVLTIDELRIKKIQLEHSSEHLGDDIARMEREIEALYEKARETTSRAEELRFATRIKTLDENKKAKEAAQLSLEKELRAVSGILVLKENEKALKSGGAWDKVQRMNSEEVEDFVISHRLEAQSKDELLSTLTEGIPRTIHPVEPEDDVADVLENIRAVKEGKLEPKEVA